MGSEILVDDEGYRYKLRSDAEILAALEDEMYYIFGSIYDVRVGGTIYQPTVELEAPSSYEYMPHIDIVAQEYSDEEGAIEFIPTLHFDDLTVAPSDYYDTIAYYIKEWSGAGDCVSQLNKFLFRPEEYRVEYLD